MDKNIVVCIGSDRDNTIRARLSLMLMNGEAVAFEHYHSVQITPACDLDEVRERVQNHLAMEQKANGIPFAPWPAIPDAEWEKVRRVCEVFHPARLEAQAEPELVVVKND
jgi:hypothetical protein